MVELGVDLKRMKLEKLRLKRELCERGHETRSLMIDLGLLPPNTAFPYIRVWSIP